MVPRREPVPDFAVTDVGRLDEPLADKGIQRAIDRRQPDRPRAAAQPPVHVLGGQVARRGPDGRQDRAALPGLPLPNAGTSRRHVDSSLLRIVIEMYSQGYRRGPALSTSSRRRTRAPQRRYPTASMTMSSIP
jgi:hypothetical protein